MQPHQISVRLIQDFLRKIAWAVQIQMAMVGPIPVAIGHGNMMTRMPSSETRPNMLTATAMDLVTTLQETMQMRSPTIQPNGGTPMEMVTGTTMGKVTGKRTTSPMTLRNGPIMTAMDSVTTPAETKQMLVKAGPVHPSMTDMVVPIQMATVIPIQI